MTWRHMRSEQALRASEQQFRAVLENVQLAALGWDGHGRITFCNDFLLQLAGWQRHEVLGQHWFDIFLPHERHNVQQRFAQGALPEHCECDIMTRQHERRLISWNITPRHDAYGRLLGVTSLGEDITARRRAAEALQRAHDELEQRVQERTADLEASYASLQREIDQRQRLEDELLTMRKLESIGLLAGGIAHDFNNILTAIVGNIALAKLNILPHDASFASLTESEHACQRAIQLTQQLLTFSKGGAPVRKPAVITDLVKESATFALRGSKVRCTFSLPGTLWPVDVDLGQMSQVINNLIINAQQSMPEGGSIGVRIENATVEAAHALPLAHGRYVRLSITDQGSGIPAEHLPQIFDPYFTTKPHGSGLGLATAYAIVHKHDGHMTVESTLGAGTTFHVYLPAAPDKAIPPMPETTDTLLSGTGRVLVMDDERAIRDLVTHVLTRLGYEVDSACDGAEAIALYTAAKASGQPFDVVIMDLTIPGGMGGKETLERLREIDPQIKAIVSSGYSTAPIMANFQHFGFRGVVAKPYRIAELSAVLHRLITADETCTAPQAENVTTC